jgi:DNA-binding NarL/FixJ family response regulator
LWPAFHCLPKTGGSEMEAGGSPTRVLIADDHALFRFGLKAALRATGGFEVVGEADTGESVVSLAAELKPEIILMDIKMPGFNGIEATRRILEADPGVGVVIVTMFEDDDSVFSAMRAGARGYVLKEADADEMIRVIRAVADGEAHFGPEIARKLRGFFSKPAAPKEVFPELTPREGEVLDMIAQGLSNTEISRRLYVSPKTVRNHVSNVFLKLQVADRSQAIVRAREAGLGRNGS